MKKLVIIALVALLMGGCAHKNESGKDTQSNYRKSLNDSIKNIQAEIDSCNDVAGTLADKINNLLPEFRGVNNSREVEGYMIFQGWENKYPLKETGLVARLSEARQLELVAVLKGGIFDHIVVTVPSATASSSIIPNDQALNYRLEDLNTVMFTGEKADSIAALIADNELNPMTVTFMNGEKVTGTWKLGNDNAKMITMTYLLYSTHKEQLRLEKRSLKLGERLKIVQEHLEDLKSDSVPTKQNR